MTDPTTQPADHPYFAGSIADAIRYLARQYPGEMTIDCARAMEALADRAEEVGEWRPIETAPRDGSEFLLAYRYVGGAAYVTVASHAPHWSRCAWWRTQGHSSIPVTDTHPAGTAFTCVPVGWMPLPEPPAIRAGAADGE